MLTSAQRKGIAWISTIVIVVLLLIAFCIPQIYPDEVSCQREQLDYMNPKVKLIGGYMPQCNIINEYVPIQCTPWGACWCSTPDGIKFYDIKRYRNNNLNFCINRLNKMNYSEWFDVMRDRAVKYYQRVLFSDDDEL
jgi:hypothetical protein